MPLVSVDAKKIAQRELEAKDKAAAEAKADKRPEPDRIESIKFTTVVTPQSE